MGKDLGLEHILELEGKAMVGFLARRKVNNDNVGDYILKNWCPLLGYCPTHNIMSKGWLGFKFVCKDDMEKFIAQI